jgi:hypothetical protein
MSDKPRRRWSRRVVIALSIGLGLIVGGATVAVASSIHHDAARVGAANNKVAHPHISGGAHASCSAGYDTESSTIIPPDDTTTDNPPAATVTFTKTCAGAVVGVFTSEVSAPNAGDYVHIDMVATCVGKGGQSQPCTIGTQLFGSPGHSFLDNGPASFGMHAVQMVWTNLPRGRWTFEVLPGGNGIGNLQFRSYALEAYAGG